MDISQNHTLTNIGLLGNTLSLSVEYGEDLEGKTATFIMNLTEDIFLYPRALNLTFRMISEDAPLVLMTYSSAALLGGLTSLLLCLSIITLIIIFAGSTLHKMVGLESLFVLQLCLAAPLMLGDRSEVFRVFNGLSFASGLDGQLFYNPNDAETFGEPFENANLPKTFTEVVFINVSVLLLTLTVLIVGCVFKRALAHELRK
jgi:hypothetical protein